MTGNASDRQLTAHDAVVSVYDSGFMLGDGMREGMRLYDGVCGRSLTSIWIDCSAAVRLYPWMSAWNDKTFSTP